MKRSVWFCLIAALGLSGITGATASAEPEFLTKAVVGEPAPSNIPFTGTIGAWFWEGQMSKNKLLCTAGTVTGEVTGPRSLSKIVLVLTGCESGSLPANSEGQPNGTIETKALAGRVGGITPTLPGVKLFSEPEGKGGTMVTAEAGGGVIKFVITGDVTGSVSGSAGEGPATGKLLASVNLTFAQSKGTQRYKGFSEGPEARLPGNLEWDVNGSGFEPIGWSLKQTMKTVPSTWGLGITK